MTVEDRLANFLRDAMDWERRATNIPGSIPIEITRKRLATIANEIKPVDAAVYKAVLISM